MVESFFWTDYGHWLLASMLLFVPDVTAPISRCTRSRFQPETQPE